MKYLLALLLLVGHAGAYAATPGLDEMRPPVAAPHLALKDVGGHLHRLSAYRGRVVVINFWATWCPPCRQEMPYMQAAWQRLKYDGVVLLAVDLGEDKAAVAEFAKEYPVTFPLLLDPDSRSARHWPIRGLPTTFILDPQGRVVYQALGARKWDDPVLLQAILDLRTRRQAPVAYHSPAAK